MRVSRRLAGSLLLGLGILGAACESPTAPGDDGSLVLHSIAKATVANHSAQGVRTVVRDPGRWQAVWAQLRGERPPALPDVDFEHEMVVVASASLVCFADVRIEAVTERPGGLHVALADSGPSSTCLCAVPETTLHAVRVRRVEGAVEFSVRTIPPTCGG
jgi:hypothetical protein